MCYREVLFPHVQACVKCYKSNWKVVKYNHRSLSSSVSSRLNLSKTISIMTPKQEFEVDFQGLPSESSSELGNYKIFFTKRKDFFLCKF